LSGRNAEIESRKMEFRIAKIQIPSETDKIPIYFIGDCHQGSGNHNLRALRQSIAEIKDNPKARWVGMGDYADHIYYTDHRYSPNSIDFGPDIQELREGIMGQIRKTSYEFEPIVSQCLGIGTGNHEEKIANKYHVDPTREMSIILKVPYLGFSSFIRVLVFRNNSKSCRYSFVIHATHSTRAPRKSGGKINVAEDNTLAYDADIYAVAHSHGMVTSKIERLGISIRGKPQYREKAYIVTGSSMENSKQGTMNYAEKGAYTQGAMGSPIVRVWWCKNEARLRLGMTI
jgi:hypothetical protein